MVLVMVTTVAGDVAALLLASAGVLAVMESVPTGKVTVIEATPFAIGAVPSGFEPL